MYLIPWSWNLLTSGAITTDAKAFLKGAPAANLLTDDPRQVALGRGVFVVETNVNDDIDLGGGSAVVAAGTYYSPQEMAVAVETAVQTVDASGYVYHRQDSAERYRFEIKLSGADTLLNNSGAGAATSWCTLLGGFRAEDRGAATTHTGDFSVQHGTDGDMVTWDQTTAKAAECAIIVNPHMTPAARPSVCFGATSAVASAEETFAGEHNTDLMASFFSSALTYRYIRFDMLDNSGTPMGSGEQVLRQELVGCGMLYVGPRFEPAHSWEVTSYSVQPQRADITARALSGQPHIATILGGERVNIAWQSSPGIGPEDVAAFRDFLGTLGMHDLVAVALDPDNEPNHMTRLCRVASSPTFQRVEGQGPQGRWAAGLDLQSVRVR